MPMFQSFWQIHIFTFVSRSKGTDATVVKPYSSPLITSEPVLHSYASRSPSSSSSLAGSPVDKKAAWSCPKRSARRLSSPVCNASLSPQSRTFTSSPEPSPPYDNLLLGPVLHDPLCTQKCISTCPYFIYHHFRNQVLSRRRHKVSADELVHMFAIAADDYSQAKEQLRKPKARLGRAEAEFDWAARRCTTTPSRCLILPSRIKHRENARGWLVEAETLYALAKAERLERAQDLFDIGRF